jgi:hypothetical protein
LLNRLDLNNVSMTGCPAWYDLDNLERDYEFKADAKNITFSLPAKPQPDTFKIIAGLSKQYPKAQKVLAMHHGWRPAKTPHGNAMLRWHVKVFDYATALGWRVDSIADGLEKFKKLYDVTDLHVGYRVHAHIYSLSQQSASILINEDTRGVGQVTALGGKMLMAGEGAASVLDAVAEHFDTQGSAVRGSTERIKATYPTMVEFLGSI